MSYLGGGPVFRKINGEKVKCKSGSQRSAQQRFIKSLPQQFKAVMHRETSKNSIFFLLLLTVESKREHDS